MDIREIEKLGQNPELAPSNNDIHPPLSYSLPAPFTAEQPSITRPVRPVDRVPSATNKYVSITSSQLYQSFAYRNIDSIIKHLPSIAKSTIKIQKDPDEKLGHIGQYATIHKNKENKSLQKAPEVFGDTVHIDIGYDSDFTIGSIKYCLFIVDRATTNKYTYSLKDLNGASLATQF